MNDFYNAEIAAIYDLMYPDYGDSKDLANYLDRVSPGKTVMEFGIGTGRLALPLTQAGYTVSGVDNSQEMLDELLVKVDKNSFPLHKLDFGRDQIPEANNDVCLLACNTIYSVLDVDSQLNVFSNAYRTLSENGVFVIEAFNPSWLQSKGDDFTQMRRLNSDKTLIEQYHIHRTTQEVVVDNLLIQGNLQNTISFTHTIRYIHPFELDALARNKGFELQERTAGFKGEVYTSFSPRIVNTYWKID